MRVEFTFSDDLRRRTPIARGKKFVLLSTRYKQPALQWSQWAKRRVEEDEGCPCFSPNQDNVNLAMLDGRDQASRDGRWLQVFLWAAMAAAFTDGRMVQLLIPGLGPSAMQLAEREIDHQSNPEAHALKHALAACLPPYTWHKRYPL